MLKKIIKIATITVVSLVVVLILSILIFVNLSPQLGQAPKGEDLKILEKSPNYKGESFVNSGKTRSGDVWEAFQKTLEMFDSEGKVPTKPLPSNFSLFHSPNDIEATYVTWFGHSAFLIETEGKRILIDPMFGDIASPIPFGSKRFDYENPIPVDQFKGIDVVLISHDHYDHLDYPTIIKIKEEVKLFVIPLGVGSHLKSWGIPANKIAELDWWKSKKVNNLSFTATPARHFSGRGLTDGDATQWAGWAIKGPNCNLYFSGDSGYGKHFKEIGEKLGPFDFSMIECGQYDESWSEIHMIPEQSVQAAKDVKSIKAMPIHWGAFRLAPHDWTDPVTRFEKKAKKEGLSYLLPTIGERFQLNEKHVNKKWWK